MTESKTVNIPVTCEVHVCSEDRVHFNFSIPRDAATALRSEVDDSRDGDALTWHAARHIMLQIIAGLDEVEGGIKEGGQATMQ